MPFGRPEVGVLAIDAESDPAGLISQFEAGLLPRGHDRRVKDVHPSIVSVGDPQLALVGRQANSVAGATMTLGGTGFEPLDLDPVQHLAGKQVTDFESEQVIDIDEAKSALAVDSEGANHASK
jgi:hypothetical protein